MLAFTLLRVALARTMALRREMPSIRPPPIGEEAPDPKRPQEGFELQEHFILATAKHLRHYFPSAVIDGVPPPAWLFLLLHKALQFVGLDSLNPHNIDGYVAGS